MVHQIRLREPWNSEKMPGGVRYTRHFNAPSGLSQESQVDLVVKSVSRRCLLYTSPSPRDGLLSRMPCCA